MTAPDTWAIDILRFSPWQGETNFKFKGFWRQRDGTQKSRDLQFEEGVKVSKSGYLLHPGILTFSSEISPIFSQQGFMGSGSEIDFMGKFLSYNWNLNFLQGRSINFNTAASKSSGVNKESRGGRNEHEIDTSAISVNFYNKYFPSSITFQTRSLNSTNVSGITPVVFERDESLYRLSYKGRSSKMNVSLQRLWFDDTLSDKDFTLDSWSLSHSPLKWGKGSKLNYGVSFSSRESRSPLKKLNIREDVRLQHTDNLYSTFSHNFLSFSQENSSNKHSANFSLNHKLYQNISSRLNLTANTIKADMSDEFSYGLRFSINYRKKIPWGGLFFTGVDNGYQVNNFKVKTGTSLIVDEEHVVDNTSIVVLNNSNISNSSIIITNPLGTVNFIEGQDYRVRVFQNITSIEFLPGGRVDVGDKVIVGYSFSNLPALPAYRSTTKTFQYNFNLDFKWIYIYYRVSQANQNLLSGDRTTFLINTENSVRGLELRWARPATKAIFTAENRSSLFEKFRTDSLTLSQSLYHSFSSKTVLSLSSNETFFNSQRDKFSIFSSELSLGLNPYPFLHLRPYLGTWIRREKTGTKEDFVNGGVDLRVLIGRVELSLEYEHSFWSGTLPNKGEDRFFLNIVRRF